VLAPVAAVAVGLHDPDLPTAGFRASAPGECSLVVTRSSGEAFSVLVRVTLPRGPYGEPVVQVAGLTWAELFAGEPVVAAQGRWLDPFASRRPAMVVDFLWRGDRCWSAFDPDGNGGLCLGTGNVLGDGGFEVFRTGPDVSMGGDDWREWPVEPPAYLVGTNVVSVDQGEVAGRLCRKVALDYEGRRGGIALDRVTAVLLAEDRGAGWQPMYENLRFNEEVRDDVADWTGPVAHDRVRAVADLRVDREGVVGNVTYRAGPCSLDEGMSGGRPLREALTWAQAKAGRVRVHHGGTLYSAGRVPLDLPALPPDLLG
jgi:hypothetical protein